MAASVVLPIRGEKKNQNICHYTESFTDDWKAGSLPT
jgi:hypothetical protein